MRPTYMLRDPELYKHIAVKNFDSFVDHQFIIEPQMDSLMGNTVFLMRGEKWRKMRSTLSPAFTGSKMRHMFELVRDCVVDAQSFLLETIFTSIGCQSEVEITDFYSRVTNDTIASCAFGLKINSLIERENEFYVTGCKLQHLNSLKSFVKIWCLRAFPWLLEKLQIEFIDSDIRKVFSNLVLQNIESRRVNKIVRPDLIDLLVHEKRASAWSDDEIISQAFVFFLAGFDTTMWVLTAFSYELALHPDIQNRLTNEIDEAERQVENRKISYEELNKMKYLDMVLMEVLRMHSPAVMIDRLCSKRFHLTDGDKVNVNIEKGDHIWVPVYCFHHNENYFPNPEQFDPERFNDENRKNIDPAHFVPFGIGPRSCIGNRFAMMEVKVVMYNMLSQFSFHRTARTEVPMKIKSSPFGLSPINGLVLSIKRRK